MMLWELREWTSIVNLWQGQLNNELKVRWSCQFRWKIPVKSWWRVTCFKWSMTYSKNKNKNLVYSHFSVYSSLIFSVVPFAASRDLKDSKNAKIAAFKIIKRRFLYLFLKKNQGLLRNNTAQFGGLFSFQVPSQEAWYDRSTPGWVQTWLLLLSTVTVVMMTVIFITLSGLVRSNAAHSTIRALQISRGDEMTRAWRGDHVTLLTTGVYPCFRACSSRHALSVGPTLRCSFSPCTTGEVTQ